ncbi:MAG TPA: antitoxin family protein [Gemmataceae bacterium]|nr:antitoxin family protein [Gemmataceae bacterium]
MVQTFEAVFDGMVFQPLTKPELAPNTTVRITVETADIKLGEPYCFLKALASLNIEGPSDMSTNVDKYAYNHQIDDEA